MEMMTAVAKNTNFTFVKGCMAVPSVVTHACHLSQSSHGHDQVLTHRAGLRARSVCGIHIAALLITQLYQHVVGRQLLSDPDRQTPTDM